MSWTNSTIQPKPAPEVHHPTMAFRDAVRIHAETLAAGLAVSERLRGRAELCRAINQTSSKNDYDFEADIIDAMIILVAQSRYEPTGEYTELSKLDDMLPSSQERRRRRLMGAPA